MATRSGGTATRPVTRKTKRASVRTTEGDTPEMTSEEALQFIRDMQERFQKTPRTRREKAALQEYLAQFSDRVLKAVGTRVQKDLMLRPPRTIRPDDFEPPRPPGDRSRKKSV
jgi:hypothetical protein